MSTPLINGKGPMTLLLAHGAGAGMDSPFMESIAIGIAAKGFTIHRFEFPYMKKAREVGKRRPPNGAKILEAAFREELASIDGPVVIGGKSMGGRIASMICDTVEAKGLVCFGYPFHPPGKPEKTRTAHLAALKTSTLILQGERDPFGKPEDVDGYLLSENIRIRWIMDGDHSLKPRKKSGRTWEQNIEDVVEETAGFMSSLE